MKMFAQGIFASSTDEPQLGRDYQTESGIELNRIQTFFGFACEACGCIWECASSGKSIRARVPYKLGVAIDPELGIPNIADSLASRFVGETAAVEATVQVADGVDLFERISVAIASELTSYGAHQESVASELARTSVAFCRHAELLYHRVVRSEAVPHTIRVLVELHGLALRLHTQLANYERVIEETL